jgi:hypothetical protein
MVSALTIQDGGLRDEIAVELYPKNFMATIADLLIVITP